MEVEILSELGCEVVEIEGRHDDLKYLKVMMQISNEFDKWLIFWPLLVCFY